MVKESPKQELAPPIEQPLNALRPGDTGEVVRLTVEGEQRRRLMDLGLLAGTTVSVEFRSPLGDPTSYRIRGALIALRDVQAQQVIVRRLGDDGPATR